MKKLLFRLIAVLAIAAGIAAAATWLGRLYMAHELAQRVGESGPAAPGLLPELARFGGEGLGPLVDAAASSDREIALAARREIGRLVRRWRQLEIERPGFDGNRSRLQLASELSRGADRFSPSGQQWLAATADALLLASPDIEPDLALTQTCDALYAAARLRSTVLEPVSKSSAAEEEPILSEAPIDLPAPPEQSASPPLVRIGELPPVAIEQEKLAKPADQFEPRWIEAADLPAPRELESIAAEPLQVEVLPTENRDSDLRWQLPRESAPTASGPAGFGWPRRSKPNPLATTSRNLAVLTLLSDSELIRIGLASDEPLVRATMIARGFGADSAGQLAASVSDREEVRASLVDDLLTSRTGSAARLLLMLAQDESPRVRYAAISALGSSRNRALIDAAWRMSLRDPDPRVAALAGELRQR